MRWTDAEKQWLHEQQETRHSLSENRAAAIESNISEKHAALAIREHKVAAQWGAWVNVAECSDC